MPADKGVRLDDRQRIANFREQPIETNEYHSVDGAQGEFLWSSSPQNVDLLPQRPNLCLKHYPRLDQIDNHPTNEPAKIPSMGRTPELGLPDTHERAFDSRLLCERPLCANSGHSKSNVIERRTTVPPDLVIPNQIHLGETSA